VQVTHCKVANKESGERTPPWKVDTVGDYVVFWTAGEQNGQAGFRDGLAFAGLVLTMYVVITARSDDNLTTTISCSSRH